MTLEIEKRLVGTVKWFNNVKGYGFIRHSSGQDVFVHYSVIEDQGFKTLNENEEVEYELDHRVKGLFAKKVARPERRVTEIIETDQIITRPSAELNAEDAEAK